MKSYEYLYSRCGRALFIPANVSESSLVPSPFVVISALSRLLTFVRFLRVIIFSSDTASEPRAWPDSDGTITLQPFISIEDYPFFSLPDFKLRIACLVRCPTDVPYPCSRVQNRWIFIFSPFRLLAFSPTSLFLLDILHLSPTLRHSPPSVPFLLELPQNNLTRPWHLFSNVNSATTRVP